MEAPKNMSRTSIVTWVIGALASVTVALFGFWYDGQKDFLAEKNRQIEDKDREIQTLKIELKDCDKENRSILLNRYSISQGQKQLVITPSGATEVQTNSTYHD